MSTYFAPAERVSAKGLKAEIKMVNSSLVVDGLLHSVSGVLAILNEHRQIIAINDSFLQMLGVKDSSEALGLRLGEVMACPHAQEQDEGCGTSKFCSTCGAAIAMVSSMEKNRPVERNCALTTELNGEKAEISLQVKSHPVEIGHHRLLLLFVQDITRQQEREALERTFFHDIGNLMMGLSGASELLLPGEPQEGLIKIIQESSVRLQKEVEIQKTLLSSESAVYKPVIEITTLGSIRNRLTSFYENHTVKKEKVLNISVSDSDQKIRTDSSLLLRILSNMITNGLEATDSLLPVDVSMGVDGKDVTFYVHNEQCIPEEISRRVFQRNFSTKSGGGRGLGTFSMKLFGEKILRGKVSFTSSIDEGTTFKLVLPC